MEPNKSEPEHEAANGAPAITPEAASAVPSTPAATQAEPVPQQPQAGTSAPGPPETPAPISPGKKSPAQLLVIAGCVLLAIAVVVFFVWHTGKDQPDNSTSGTAQESSDTAHGATAMSTLTSVALHAPGDMSAFGSD